MTKIFFFSLMFMATLYAAVPSYQAQGTAKNGTGSATPTWPVHQINDIALLFVETRSSDTVTLSTPAGFLPVTSSPQATGSVGGFLGSNGTRLSIFWARATSSNMTSPVIADPGNHIFAQILTYRGVVTSGNPWDITVGGVKTTASDSLSVTGVTTTLSDTLIVQAASRDTDSASAAFSAQTNANLTNITERIDTGTTSGDGGGIGVWDGEKTISGMTGNTSVSVAPSGLFLLPRYALNAFITIALKPDIPPALSTCGTEDFNAYTSTFPFTNNWTIIKQENYTPQILNGTLMLTNLGGNIATGVTLNGSLPASNNYFEITFQSFAYGGTGADGITLTLSDAAVAPVTGAFEGSLGYAQKTAINGFAGGWLGFGLDEYGNFSNPTEGRSGGPGFRVDSVAIRGSGSGTTGYPYIAGTTTLTPGIDQNDSTPGPGHWYRMSIDTRNTNTWVKIERNTNTNGTGNYVPLINWTNATQVAAAPTNYRLSLTGSTGGSNNYHSTDNFTLKAINCGTITIVTPTPSSRFDAWDDFRSLSDRNISTKIVGKEFNLTIASLNSTNSALQDFNGTVCATIINSAGTSISGWNKLLFSTASSVTSGFTLNRAIGGNDSAGIKLNWKKNVNSTCPLTAEDNSTIASDRFAVRPASFTLSAPNAIAGSDFNITFSAANFSTTASADYNETVSNSFDVSYAEHNSSCMQGTFTPAINSGWSFINGIKAVSTRYNEVGVVDINISDISKTCSAKYANVDCDDANVIGFYNSLTDLPIGTKQAQITVKPHHFDLNATLTNFNAGTFTYLSTDLNMSSKLDLNATAKNEQNVTTLNYDKGCYAKTTTLSLPHSTVPNPLSTILVHENLSNLDTNITKSNPINLSFDKTIFTQGLAPLHLLINFDRSRSQPLNPFDFNLSSASLTDSDGSTGTTTPTGNASYIYGRARAYDIKTDQSSAPNPIELEIYSSSSTGYVSGMPQNVLYWYRNLNHTNLTQGSILSGDDYSTTTKTGVSSTISIDPLFYTPSNGLHSILINNPDAISHATIHLDIPTWLWYSTVNNYDFTNGSKCTQHPCFDYQFFDTSASGAIGVNSGTFQGSDFNLAPAKKNINKGVKVFR